MKVARIALSPASRGQRRPAWYSVAVLATAVVALFVQAGNGRAQDSDHQAASPSTETSLPANPSSASPEVSRSYTAAGPSSPGAADTAAQQAEIGELRGRVAKLEERLQQLEIAAFDSKQAASRRPRDLDEQSGQREVQEALPAQQPGPRPQVPPTVTSNAGRDEGEPLVTSDGFALMKSRSGSTWSVREALAAELALPSVEQCDAAGRWLLANAGNHRRKNELFVRSDAAEVLVCGLVNENWETYSAERGTSIHIVVVQEGVR